MRATALLALLLLLAPGASLADPLAGAYAWRGEGPFWHVVRLEAPQGATLAAEVVLDAEGSRTEAGGLWLLDAQGRALRAVHFAAWLPEVTQLHLEAPGLGMVASHLQGGADAERRFGFEGLALGPGSYVLVAVGAAEGAGLRAELSVGADAPLQPGPAATGREVSLAREADFTGGLNALLSVPGPLGGALQARVVLGGSTALIAEQRLFGAFAARANGSVDMALVTPEGVQDGSTFYALDNAGPGAYQFLLRHLVDYSLPHPGCALAGCRAPAAWALVAHVALA